jgi:hypothetical protein
LSANALAFDHWIRGGFVTMNSALEELYFAQADRANVEASGTTSSGRCATRAIGTWWRFGTRAILATGLKPRSACWAMSDSIWRRCADMN